MLSRANTENYDEKLVKATLNKGDCCMMTLLEWGHSRDNIVENPADFDDEDHMNFHGEFGFTVNETIVYLVIMRPSLFMKEIHRFSQSFADPF